MQLIKAVGVALILAGVFLAGFGAATAVQSYFVHFPAWVE